MATKSVPCLNPARQRTIDRLGVLHITPHQITHKPWIQFKAVVLERAAIVSLVLLFIIILQPPHPFKLDGFVQSFMDQT